MRAEVALGTAYLETGNRAKSAEMLAKAEEVRATHPHLAGRFEGPLLALRRNLASLPQKYRLSRKAASGA